MKLRKRQLIAASYIIVALLLYRSVEPVFSQITESEHVALISQFPVSPVPVRKQTLTEPILNATAAYVTDENSGAILYSKNANIRYAPASTTKLMTALTARELYRPETVITVAPTATVGGTMVGLRSGEQYTLDSLLEAALIHSGNDAAQVLAEHHPRGVSGFIADMNIKAEALGMNSTHFSNPIGFDAQDHYSTARDLAILARAVVKDEKIRSMVGTKEKIISNTLGNRRIRLKNTNQLLGQDKRVKGIKTGTTEEAGEVLVAMTEEDSKILLFVVLGSTSRYTDTLLLVDWITANYSWYMPDSFGSQPQW